VDLVGSLPEGMESNYHSIQQPGNRDLLYMVPSTGTSSPGITEFNTTAGNVTWKVQIPFPRGYDYAAMDGCFYMKEGNYILVFLEFLDRSDTLPLRNDLVAKFDIEFDTVTLVQIPQIAERWHNVVSPFQDDLYLYLFSAFGDYPNQTMGIYRIDLGRNETDFFEVVVFNEPEDLLRYSSSLYVPNLNRLYIFGGHDLSLNVDNDEIWYVDLSPINRPIPEESTRIRNHGETEDSIRTD